MTHFAKVDCFSTTGEEEESIEALEEHGGWLMDRAENSLARYEVSIDYQESVKKPSYPFLVNFSMRSQIAQDV